MMSVAAAAQGLSGRKGQAALAIEFGEPALLATSHVGIERHGDRVDHVLALDLPAAGVMEITVEGRCLLICAGIAGIGDHETVAMFPGDACGHRPVGGIDDVALRVDAERSGHIAVVIFDPPVDQLPCADEIRGMMRHT